MTRLLLTLLLAAGLAAAQTLSHFDAFVEQSLKEFQVPGAAIAVVKDGKVILSQGYGWRDSEGRKPVTPKTLFAIGSTSKSFTVAVLSQLAEQSKMEWEKPVRTYLPDFQMFDPVAAEQMTPRDLVTHRSGLPRHDLVWLSGMLTRQQLYDRLRYLEPTRGFRASYQYQNLMFMTAGLLAGKIAGTTWEDLVRQKIFAPLGMSTSNFSVNDSQKTPDHALPYQKVKEQVERVPFRVIDQIGPAGSINSCVDEMIRYISMYLGKGAHAGGRILAERSVADMTSPHMPSPGPNRYSEIGDGTYGMGLALNSYRGHKVVSHGGGIDGFTALISWMPQDNIGMVILSNLGGTQLPAALSYRVYDQLLGLAPVDWTARFKQDAERQRAQAESRKPRPVPNTRPSRELGAYAGDYEHPAYGTMRVEMAGGGLRVTFHTWSAPLEHFHYDVFQTPEDPRGRLSALQVQFLMDRKGEVVRLATPLEASGKDIVFARGNGQTAVRSPGN